MIVEVTIESLGGLGDGIASLRGKPLFVPKSCVGDRLEIRITHETREKYQGVIQRVIEPGPARQPAPCPYFDRCGGCTLQQLDNANYQRFKRRILHNALAQAGFPSPEAPVLFVPPHTRRRVEFKIQHSDGKIMLAFHELRSHTPVPIKECLVLHPKLASLITPLNEALTHLPFTQSLYAASLTLADSGIELWLTLKNISLPVFSQLDSMWDSMCKALSLTRISVRSDDTEFKVVTEITPTTMQLGEYAVPLPPGAFLQSTLEGQQTLTNAALKVVKNGSSVVDLFCGIGTYSFPISRIAKVHAVEGEDSMVQAIKQSANHHNIHTLTSEHRDLFKQPLTHKELARFDTAIINPPRLGAKAQTEQLAQSNIHTIVMISCNPATFARDAAILKKSGFILSYAGGIDQFLWSQHLEIVATFNRE